MALDPYHQLGVSRDADEAAIRRAFRKAASIHHPDKNPDDPHAATRFRLVRESYEILIDPERRARYDNGGDCSKRDTRAAALNAVAGALFEVLGKQGDCELIAGMRRHCQAQIAKIKRKTRETEANAKTLERVKSRFRFKGDGENVIEATLDSQAQLIADHLRRLAQDLETWTDARKILDEYEDVELQSLMSFVDAFSSSSTWSGTE